VPAASVARKITVPRDLRCVVAIRVADAKRPRSRRLQCKSSTESSFPMILLSRNNLTSIHHANMVTGYTDFHREHAPHIRRRARGRPERRQTSPCGIETPISGGARLGGARRCSLMRCAATRRSRSPPRAPRGALPRLPQLLPSTPTTRNRRGTAIATAPKDAAPATCKARQGQTRPVTR
jgi:hypothetical protein